jgi:hypothetical protein
MKIVVFSDGTGEPGGVIVKAFRRMRDVALHAFDAMRGLPPYDPADNVKDPPIQLCGCGTRSPRMDGRLSR